MNRSYRKYTRFPLVKKNFYIFMGIFLTSIFISFSAVSHPKDNTDRETILTMIERLIPGKSNLFILKNIPGNGSDSFQIQSQKKNSYRGNQCFIYGKRAKLLSQKLLLYNVFLVCKSGG